MTRNLELSDRLYDQFEAILKDLRARTQAECVLLADISGQLISKEGRLQDGNPVQVAALAAGDMSAMTELLWQIGERNPHGSFFHEGEKRSLYLFNINESFILIVVSRSSKPVGLVRLFIRRAAERLHPLTSEFEEIMGQQTSMPMGDFGTGLAEELEKAFTS